MNWLQILMIGIIIGLIVGWFIGIIRE